MRKKKTESRNERKKEQNGGRKCKLKDVRKRKRRGEEEV